MTNKHLSRARINKDDEFYTRRQDVISEISNYLPQLRGKVIYCCCDDPCSEFVAYFYTNFHQLQIKKMFSTGISGICIEYDGIRKISRTINGDFRSDDCKAILLESDVIITNPPFSLFRDFLGIIKGKDFLVLGSKNAISTKELFPMIQSGSVKLGYTKPAMFYRPDGSVASLQGMCRWFTTLETSRTLFWTPTASYATSIYQKYDHYPAINVDRVADIPADYDGLMGVPITYLDNIDYSSYEIVDLITRYAVLDKSYGVPGHQLTEIDGKPRYSRLVIRKKQ